MPARRLGANEGAILQEPALPENETARLRTLRALDLLGSGADERFDRVTRIARQLFRVPMALVTLVDENEQAFKSCSGVAYSRTSRDVSFCGHAILGDEPLVVPDAHEDERFHDNPLVLTDPAIRFYAGQPLRAPNGQKLGTLCIMDQQPRNMSSQDLDALRDLAAMVEQEIRAIYMATLDELTHLPNRRGFMQLARKELELCARGRLPATLVFMDLDAFKPINDRYGHAQGDLALTVFAEQMTRAFRGSDVLGRLGGDEFVVLLTNTGQDQAHAVVTERFRPALNGYLDSVGFAHAIAFSYGIVEFEPDRNPALEDLIEQGDALMYEYKGRGEG
jgi:diguanylate cyclase (GGDEF)-like protein